jgi:hypothetical protein
MCNCKCRIHSFVCFLRNIASDMNRSAMNAGKGLNAR